MTGRWIIGARSLACFGLQTFGRARRPFQVLVNGFPLHCSGGIGRVGQSKRLDEADAAAVAIADLQLSLSSKFPDFFCGCAVVVRRVPAGIGAKWPHSIAPTHSIRSQGCPAAFRDPKKRPPLIFFHCPSTKPAVSAIRSRLLLNKATCISTLSTPRLANTASFSINPVAFPIHHNV